MPPDVSPGIELGIKSHVPAVETSKNSRRGGSTPTVLGDRYSLTKRIAIGGMGEVWAATDMVLGREVAVKILRDELVDSPVFLARFRAEARHTAALAHPGIASVFDYGEDGDDDSRVAYLVMELVPGRPLSKVMAQRGTLPINMVLSVLAQAAEALHAAHVKGVVHRDVKPGNLLLLDDGTIKVTDFGIARAANSAALTEVGQVIGTARYIAPEQATGHEATPASDVYSLGVIGYEMLAGHPPFAADNAAALAMAHALQAPPPLPPTVPEDVQVAIAEALSKDPNDRPRDAHEFAAKLRALQSTTVPAPGAAAGRDADSGEPTLVDDHDQHPSTVVMSRDDGSRTAIMPKGLIVASTPGFGLSQEAHASRRQRRRLGLAALAAVVMVVVVVLFNGADATKPLDLTTTTVATPDAAATVDPKILVGLSTQRASDVLSKAGFVVAINPVDAVGVPAGTVTGVHPSGQVPSGATVTLNVSKGAVASATTTASTSTTVAPERPRKKGHKPNG
jgi:serine/threonine protein kinase